MRDKVCVHYPCIVSERTGRDCASPENCQTRKFYDKYPNYPRMDEEYLGVGAMMIPPRRLSDKGIEDNLDSQKSRKA